MPYASVNGIRMYYEELGDPAAVPLVLMHGATGAIDSPGSGWTDLMPLFAERYRAIHLEHRGHGRTDNPAGELSYAMIASDVCAFIEQLDLVPAHIAGFSDGGITALHIGMTRPDLARTLIAVGPNYLNDDLVIEANRFAEESNYDDPVAFSEMARLHDRNKPAGAWRELLRQTRANLAVNPAYTLADLAQIPNPTLLMAGEDDLWGNRAQMFAMREAIPNAELLIVNHAGHTIQDSHPWIVGPTVMDFLARHDDWRPEPRTGEAGRS